MTFEQLLQTNPALISRPDQMMPSLGPAGPLRCPRFGCRYIVTSVTDGRRHSETSGHPLPGGIFTCKVCRAVFQSAYFLSKHVKDTGHKQTRVKKKY